MVHTKAKCDEIAACDANNVRYYELPIALDTLTVVVNPQNSWANDITTAELKKNLGPQRPGLHHQLESDTSRLARPVPDTV